MISGILHPLAESDLASTEQEFSTDLPEISPTQHLSTAS